MKQDESGEYISISRSFFTTAFYRSVEPMTFLKIVASQVSLLLVAAVGAMLIGGLLVSPSFHIFERPAGFFIVTLINTLPYILLGSALSGLRYMTALRLSIATVVFFVLTVIVQCLSVFVAAPSIHLTRYLGASPLFLYGKVTLSGLIVHTIDIFAATAAFFLAASIAGVYPRESKS